MIISIDSEAFHKIQHLFMIKKKQLSSKLIQWPPPRVMEIKINKWDLIKLKSFYTAKETIDKVKRQLTEWVKIFANGMTDEGLIVNICKQLIQLNIRKKQTT